MNEQIISSLCLFFFNYVIWVVTILFCYQLMKRAFNALL